MTIGQFVTRLCLLIGISSFGLSSSFAFPLPLPPSDTHVKAIKKQDNVQDNWHQITITPGSSFISLLKKHHLPNTEWYRLDDTARHTLHYLHPGHELSWQTQDKHLTALRYKINQTTTLDVNTQHDQLVSTISTKELTPKNDFYHLVIQHSLSQSLHRTHLPASFLLDIQHMFSHQVNLHQLRKGDSLDLLIKNHYLENTLASHGQIIAAVLTHHHASFKAFRYTLPNQVTGFYDEHGESLLLSLDHWPCHFKRISSGFSYHRMDPVVHRYASHLGLDLATPTGTLVHSIGNGVVILRRWDGGYGKAIKVRYGHHFVALYAHLSRYASHLHKGDRVHRGQVIGYVGQTGWATGPHLHFGFYVSKTAVDWRHFKRPVNPSIPKRYMTDYTQFVSMITSEMALFEDSLTFKG